MTEGVNKFLRQKSIVVSVCQFIQDKRYKMIDIESLKTVERNYYDKPYVTHLIDILQRVDLYPNERQLINDDIRSILGSKCELTLSKPTLASKSSLPATERGTRRNRRIEGLEMKSKF